MVRKRFAFSRSISTARAYRTIFRNPLIMGGVLPSLANDSFTMNLLTNTPVLFMHGTAKNSRPVAVTINQVLYHLQQLPGSH